MMVFELVIMRFLNELLFNVLSNHEAVLRNGAKTNLRYIF